MTSFEDITAQIDAEYAAVQARVNEIQTQLDQEQARLSRLVAARMGLLGKTLKTHTGKASGRTHTLTPEGAALRKASTALTRAKNRGDAAEVKRLTPEVEKLKKAYDKAKAKA